MMDRDDENMVDPPDTQGGGGKGEPEPDESGRTVDPPSTDGGTKG